MTIALTAVATVMAGAFAISGAKPSRFVTLSLLAGLGGAILVATERWGTGNVGPLLFALIVAVPLASGLRARRLLASVVIGAGALLLARFAASEVMTANELSALPGWASAGLAGVAVSAASVFALLPRHLHLVPDPVATAHKQLNGRINGEIADLVERSNALWSQAKEELDEDDANRQILEEAVLRLMDTANRWSNAEHQSGTTSAASLAERMEALETRIEKATDEIVIEQYRLAHSALAEQLRYLSGISNNRERVLARMHNYLAAMERLRLAVANLKSTTASREAVDLAPIVENLEELGQDIDSCTTALNEL